MIVYCKHFKKQVLSEADCYYCKISCKGCVLPEDVQNPLHKDYTRYDEGFYKLDNLLRYLYNVIIDNTIMDNIKDIKDIKKAKKIYTEIYTNIYKIIEEYLSD